LETIPLKKFHWKVSLEKFPLEKISLERFSLEKVSLRKSDVFFAAGQSGAAGPPKLRNKERS
jgi:hypothetical protein